MLPTALEILKERAVQQREDIGVARRNIDLAQLYVDEIYFRYLPSLNATFTYSGARESAFAPSEPQWSGWLAPPPRGSSPGTW